MPKRTKSKTRPRRKSRKGGFLGIRSTKTWKDNHYNCTVRAKESDSNCRSVMKSRDYHSNGRFDPWSDGNQGTAKRMWSKKSGSWEIINPLVTVSTGDTFRVDLE